MSKFDPIYQSYIPNITSVNEEVSKICDSIEAHFVHVGASINEALRSAPWLPDALKPPPPSPPPPRHVIPAIPIKYFDVCMNWVSQNRAVTAAALAFVGTGGFILWRRRSASRQNIRRRARRARNGSRTEVVVLAGSVHSPLTRSIALDLERKGFIVYIPISDLTEEHLVDAFERVDIRSLSLDITSPSSTADTLEKFGGYLSPLNSPYKHKLHLVSLVILPASPLSPASIAALHPLAWSDTVTTHLLAPFTTIHAFFPLLSAHKPSVLFLTPSIIPSLTPPSHGLDNVTAGAMQSYISTLRKEVLHQGIDIIHFKLGTFDYRDDTRGYADGMVDRALVLRAIRDRMPEAGGKGPAVATRVPVKGNKETTIRGSSMRELHDSIFDVIARGKGRGGTVYVGQGSRTYDLVSRWVPGSLIGWILEYRKQRFGKAQSNRMSAD